MLEQKQETKSDKIGEIIEQFWTEATHLLNTSNNPSSEIYSLIIQRLDWDNLSKYDTQFNLIKDSIDQDLATQQKEKIISDLWNPLFKKAKTFDDYSHLLNWVMPVNKKHPFCSDHELTNTVYDVLAKVVDENTTSESIISVLRPEEFYDLWENKYTVFNILSDFFEKNGNAEELSEYINPWGDHEYLTVIKNIVNYDIHSPYLNKVKMSFGDSDWREILELLEIEDEDIEDFLYNLE